MYKLYLFLLIFFNCGLLHAHERITSFLSNIIVNVDATLDVQETIEVISEHKEILHGIVREFPLSYLNTWGKHYVVDFKIQSIMHNGYVVPYKIELGSNGKKIYIGTKDSLVPQGKNTYVISYITNRQLGFFDDYDELYWNVTGSGWRLPIDKVQAYVQLPQGITQQEIGAEAYTGAQGEQGNNYFYFKHNNSITFSTNHGLKALEGLSIVATFPKGFVIEPSWYQKVYWFFRDNFLILLLCIGLFLLFTFMSVGVMTARHINKPGVIIPIFYPPVGMTPSDVGFMKNMQFKHSLLLPDILDLAVHNYISITYKPNIFFGGTYILKIKDLIVNIKNQSNISDYHKDLLVALFANEQSITISQRYNAQIKAALDQCNIHTSKQSDSYITVLNYFWYGSCLLLFLLLCSTFSFLSGFAIELCIFSALITLGFSPLLKKIFMVYTAAGRTQQDAIDGFKLYLSIAEMDRMNIIGTPPTKTPELYEKYLPYAIALGIEKQWTTQFSGVFEKIAQEKGHAYHPLWYHGKLFKAENFQSHFMTSFSSAIVTTNIISAASISPGSFSGSGSKGKSGGGGGGGGGGGW